MFSQSVPTAPSRSVARGTSDPRDGSAGSVGDSRWVMAALLGVLAAVAILLRWFARSQLYYGWDVVQYALGIERFDLADHRPHPPGCFYYVMLGRFLTLFTHDPHTSLLVISATCGGLLVGVAWYLAREWGGEAAGTWAALMAAFAPIFCFYGAVGLPYAVEGVVASLVALAAWRLARGDHSWGTALGLGLAYGLAIGFRPTVLPFLLPIWLVGMRRLVGHEPVRAAVSIAALLLLTLGWFVPTVISAGGLTSYLELNAAMTHMFRTSAVWAHGWDPAWIAYALRRAGTTHATTLLTGVAPGVALLVLAIPFAGGRAWPLVSRAVLRFATLWVLPAFLFYLLAHFNSPGYALTYMAGLVCVVAVALARCFAVLPWGAAALGQVALTATMVWCFWVGIPGMPPERWDQLALTRAEISHHDRYFQRFRDYVRSRFAPGEVIVLAGTTSSNGLRTLQGIMPEYAEEIYIPAAAYPRGLPEPIRRLRWLRFFTPQEYRRATRPIVAAMRTHNDAPNLAYNLRVPPERWYWAPLGEGFHAVVIAPPPAVSPG